MRTVKDRLYRLSQCTRSYSSELKYALLHIFSTFSALLVIGATYYASPGTIPYWLYISVVLWFLLSVSCAIFAILTKRRPSLSRIYFLLLVDVALITAILASTKDMGALFWGGYLWIIIGYAMRYWSGILWFSYAASLVGFSFVLGYNEWWKEHQSISAGLYLSLLFIPLYLNRLMADINKSVSLAKESSDAKSDFLAYISHELRTPLNGIVAAGELLSRSPMGVEQKELLRSIVQSSKILHMMVDSALTLSRAENGQIPSIESEFDLHRLIEDVVEMFIPAAQGKGVELRTNIHPSTPMLLHGDRQHLTQILVNLVANGLKFTDAGYVEISVHPASLTESSALLKFVVKDTGVGIHVDEQKKLFKRYSQANISAAFKHGGAGLGASIAYELVKLMKGDIGLSSNAGAGSSFWFTIPFETMKAMPSIPVGIDELVVIGLCLDAEDEASFSEHINGWGASFNPESSANLFFSRLRQLVINNRKNIVVVFDPKNIGMELSGFAQMISDVRAHAVASFVMLSDNKEDVLADALGLYGFSASITKGFDKKQLFGILHSATSPKVNRPLIPDISDAERVSLRVLVADDNGTNRMIVRRILEHGGHQVFLAATGSDALVKLSNQDIDLAILDLNMPDISGVDVIKAYRKSRRHPGIKFIILTADSSIDAIEECKDAGVEAFLTKPIDVATLLNTVSRVASPATVIAHSIVSSIENDSPASYSDIIDVKALNELISLGGDDNFMMDVIFEYLEETEGYISMMKESVESANAHSFKAYAHIIKGSSGNIGAMALFSKCSEIMRLEPGEFPSVCLQQYNQLELLFKQTKEALLSIGERKVST